MQSNLFKSEEDYIRGFKENDQQSIRFLYKLHFPMVLNFIVNNNGSEEEAKDIYQETFIVLFNNLQNPDFVLDCQLKTYIYSIVRRMWLNELKSKKQNVGDIFDVEGFVLVSKDEETEFIERDRNFKQMELSLGELGEPCSTILTDFYINKMNMSDICEKMGYTNPENAKNQKYKCLVRLRKIFFTKSKKLENVR